MTKEKFNEIITSLNNVSEDCPEITDEMAYDIACETILSNPGLEAFIKKHERVTDAVGWLMQEVN